MDKQKQGNAPVLGLVLALLFIIGVVVFWQSQRTKMDAAPIVKEEEGDSMITKVLAKKNSTFTEFNKKDYERALSEGKIVYLEFYANWCPICRAQEPELIEGFNMLNRADVAGFRVNYKDDQTDGDEKELATKYKIPYQHHKIVLKEGKVVIDSAESWDAQTLVSELSKL